MTRGGLAEQSGTPGIAHACRDDNTPLALPLGLWGTGSGVLALSHPLARKHGKQRGTSSGVPFAHVQFLSVPSVTCTLAHTLARTFTHSLTHPLTHPYTYPKAHPYTPFSVHSIVAGLCSVHEGSGGCHGNRGQHCFSRGHEGQ